MFLPLVATAAAGVFTGCKDDYPYDDKEPDNLGASIYEYLSSQPDFKYAVRLIDEMGYTETLSKTGSKTLFPASDAAFERFFASNPYGVKRYEELTVAQKKIIMNSCMVNMAYLSDMLPNVANMSGTDGGGRGLALRRFTSSSYLDSVESVTKDRIIDSPFWSRFQGKGVYLWQEPAMMVHFTPQFMTTAGVSFSDFQVIYGTNFSREDIYVNNVKVERRDIICKNGYIHVMEEVLLPSPTMAQIIDTQSDTKIFKKLLDNFCAPYYTKANDQGVKEYYDGSSPLRPLKQGLTENDSVFVKRYFNETNCTKGPRGEDLSRYGMLYYDPANPLYSSSSAQQDMGVMFVPSDRAMKEYFNGPDGSYLKASYGTWENVPTDIQATFIKNHQKRSFISSVPHLWPSLTDETSYPLSIKPSDIERTIPASNGVVYVINKVLPPIDYKGVYASTLTSSDTQVMKWAVTDDWWNLGDSQAMRYYMYFRSMENMYNLLVPTDEAFHRYRDPISWAIGGNAREVWDIHYSVEDNGVIADVYLSDEQGNPQGAKIRTVRTKSIIRNRIADIMDMHIIVGQNAGGKLSGYVNDGSSTAFITKGGATILVKGSGNNVKFNGGGDRELGLPHAGVLQVSGMPAVYDSQNGRTFFIDHILHDPSQNVYQVLSSNPQFSRFFELCLGDDRVSTMFENDKDFEDIFSTKRLAQSSGIGQVVRAFNNFRYTILVPTNQAIDAALASDPLLHTWEEIASDIDPDSKKRKALYLLKFLKYHFIDNSAYLSGKAFGAMEFETGARNSFNRFHKVKIQSDGTSLSITDEKGNTARVLASEPHNFMARDLIVNNTDVTKATEIVSSSRAVIHQIDRALNYKN